MSKQLSLNQRDGWRKSYIVTLNEYCRDVIGRAEAGEALLMLGYRGETLRIELQAWDRWRDGYQRQVLA